MHARMVLISVFVVFLGSAPLLAQNDAKEGLLTIDMIYKSAPFEQEEQRTVKWIENGNAYVTIEKSKNNKNADELVRYDSKSQKRSIYVAAKALKKDTTHLNIESFSLSPDGSKVLIFTNSSRVWRSNTKGDYWVYDFESKKLKQLGASFKPSSLMFAKFSGDNKYVAYVQGFNIYREDFKSGKITQLTFDGTDKIINGTFDWAYEEEFGKRDGFAWSPDARYISYWQIDAREIGTFYMINNTDSIYSQIIPLQYPKVGEDPSGAKAGYIDLKENKRYWVDLPGGEKENYIVGIQWAGKDLLLLQQMNRKQNKLIVWKYIPSTKKLSAIYTETEETWVDLKYPDLSRYGWASTDLPIVDKGTAFLRMTENDAWRHVYKINLKTGAKTLVTNTEYDVASVSAVSTTHLYFIASPHNSTQRYLYRVNLNGKDKPLRVTPKTFAGVNTYNVSPNGKYGLHTHQSIHKAKTVRLVSLPQHKTVKELIKNETYSMARSKLKLPKIEFKKVTTVEGIEIDARIIYPVGFDKNKKYPVLFHVYGEPWTVVASDTDVGLWNIYLAQQGYVIVDMDNRGTPCLKGSAWRKSIYRKIGIINAHDQALAAKEVLKWPFIDAQRTAVWGWSGGGSMTLNLMFKYPDIYKTGISVAPVGNQLAYDNIYQERYMGLPQENREDFIKGSPVTYAQNLQGNLLIIHGTGDDNVHYQNTELVVNALIKHDKQFDMMAYPNRAHGIKEGSNTRRHLYKLMTRYLLQHTPVNK